MSATHPVPRGPGPGGEGIGTLLDGLSPPRRLRRLGTSAWLLVGIALILGFACWVLATASIIVGPLLAGGIVAIVASPLVARLKRLGLARGLGAAIVLVVLVVLVVVILIVVLRNVVAQGSALSDDANAAAGRLQSWLQSAGAGASASKSIESGLEAGVPKLIHGLASGLVKGIKSVSTIALGVSFTFLTVFFLLKDGPKLRDLVGRHLGVPEPTGRIVVRRLIRSIRGYFLGVTFVAAFNGVLVGLAAWALGVPLAATIGVVTFSLAYIPFIGAFVAGAFAVVIALGSSGTGTAVVMLVVVILANGLLQNIFSPFAMGAALDLNPLLSLVVTIGAGALFGMFGLILAAPLTSAALHVGRDLRREDEAADRGGEVPDPAPG